MIIEIAFGTPAVLNMKNKVYTVYAELKYPIPSSPRIYERGTLYITPIIFTIIAEIPSNAEPFTISFFALLIIHYLKNKKEFTKLY